MQKSTISFLPMFLPYKDPANPLVKETVLLYDSD